MKNVYDNGEMVLGAKKYVEKYMINNCENLEEIKDILEDIKDLENDTILAINYDLGMGYSIDYWRKEDIVESEGDL